MQTVTCAKCGVSLGIATLDGDMVRHGIPDDIAERCLTNPSTDPAEGFSCPDLYAALDAHSRAKLAAATRL